MVAKHTKTCRLCNKSFRTQRLFCPSHGILIQRWIESYGFMATHLWLDRWKYPLEVVKELKTYAQLINDRDVVRWR